MLVGSPSPWSWVALIHSGRLAVTLGLATHLFLCNGEWDYSSHKLLYAWLAAFGGVVTLEYLHDPDVTSIVKATQAAGVASLVYFGSLIASIAIYRAFFHRLRKFPGPFILRLSKLSNISYVLPRRQWYKEVERLHKKYNSDIIRTGPRELSIIDIDAIPLIHGPTNRCTKGPWYGFMEAIEGRSLQTTRSKQEHKERRKAWDQALSTKSLRDYEPRLNRHAYALVSKLQEHAHEESVRISNWVNFYSFDVMGDIGYNHKFGMVEKGKEDRLIELLHTGMVPLSVFNHVPWALSFLLRHGAAGDVLEFSAWTASTLKERKKITPKERDIFGWLLNPEDEDIPLPLIADSKLMTVAGSDTTAATLTWLLYELCKNPSVQTKLRNTVDQIKPEKAFLDAEDLTNCPYLDAVINETLRLHPAVPSGAQRETPPEGLTLPNGTYIPGETLIWMPPHTIHRNPRHFSSPLTFAPERWIKPECKSGSAQTYTADKRAFISFGVGAYSCVGQKLAVIEMRTVTANIMRAFEVRFAKGEDGSRIENETKDCFTLCVGALDVKLAPRKDRNA